MLKKGLLLTNSNKVSLDIYLPLEKLISLTHPQFLQENNKNRTKKLNRNCAIFIFIFAETEDALAKLIFLMANKCLS